MTTAPYRICVICSGNICRSPMAEVVLRRMFDRAGLSDEVQVDSAGTGDWHVGDPADPRALRALQRAGYDGSQHRARQFDPRWYGERDLVLVADRRHLSALRDMAPEGDDASRVRLLREFDPVSVRARDLELNDPYYDGDADFEECLDQIVAAGRGVVEFVQERLAERGQADADRS